jgi:hypothetical protein
VTLPILLTILTFATLPVHWLVAFRQWRMSAARPGSDTLRERALVPLAPLVTLFAVVFLNNDQPLDLRFLDGFTTQWSTRAAVVALVIPCVLWLRLGRKKSS